MKWFKNFIVKICGGIKLISKEDLLKLVGYGDKWIDKIDTNKDNKIDIKELIEFIKGHK